MEMNNAIFENSGGYRLSFFVPGELVSRELSVVSREWARGHAKTVIDMLLWHSLSDEKNNKQPHILTHDSPLTTHETSLNQELYLE